MQNKKRFLANKLPLAAAITAAVMATPALAVDFHGYARAGLSTTSDGGEQLCYGSGANAHTVGRLGDECDTYGELSLGDELFNQDGKVFRFDTMVAYQATNQGNDYQSLSGPNEVIGVDFENEQTTLGSSEPWAGGDIALRQAYGSAKGVIGWAPEATLWAGKRFYQRKDVHILDLYYVNNSGYGAGLEGVDVGPGKASFAVTNFDTPSRHSGDSDGGLYVQNNKLDLRYAFPVGPGNLELIGIYGYADLTDAQDEAQANLAKEIDRDGYFFTAEYSQGVMGGFNKFVVQYAEGSMGHQAYVAHGGGESLNSTWWDGTIKESWRVLDWGVIKLSDKIELGYSAIYQQGKTHGNTAEDSPHLMSVVLRPEYNWTNFMKTTLEVGYDSGFYDGSVWSEDNDKDLQKVIVAQEWSAGHSFWARPTIRVYAGSFFGDRAEDRDDDGNIRVGAQVEAWW
ncbi:maltoporin LamB [Marinobacter lipolyticus]|uniref:maltoporin LamB n=1 Tax=Marinobacter lipolyticus TaxID=209639 RepID=UPI003A9531C3